MNICFIQGRIISGIEFKFIIKENNYSIAIFKIILNNNSIVKVKGFNEIADYCYKNLCKNEIINICGYLNKKASCNRRNILIKLGTIDKMKEEKIWKKKRVKETKEK